MNRLALLIVTTAFMLSLPTVCGAAKGKVMPDSPKYETHQADVAKLLAAADLWLMPQPKAVAVTAEHFSLRACKGIRLVGTNEARLKTDFPALLAERTGIRLKASKGPCKPGYITFALIPERSPVPQGVAVKIGDLKGLGDQGYYVRVDRGGVVAAATTEAGLYYASRTIAQMAAGRTDLHGIVIRDWPSLTYRGFQYDVSRGQMPRIAALKRLVQVAAEAKMNMFEPYIEHQFNWSRHPDIAPPEAITPKQARELFDWGARYRMDVHPMMQTFGHFYNIGLKPAYRQYMVADGGTVDIRKPEAVAFVLDLIDEMCDAFPAKFFNVDITEINDAAFKESGTTQEQLTDLTLQYALKIRETVAKHGMRLMIAQGPLSMEGSLTGLGSVISKFPKDMMVSSYYTAEFYGGWDKDFPRLHKAGLDFFAQPWIDSHAHIMPYVGHAMDFSDITVSRALQHGALGSLTTDWGDDGHYHLPSLTWYPFLYHASSAWAGAELDRAYFDRAFCRLFFGAHDDAIARAIALVGNINGQPLKLRNAAGGIDEPAYVGNSRVGRYYYEFFGDPFTCPQILDIVDPAAKGREIMEPAEKAVAILEQARKDTIRNRDVVEHLRFAARNYVAMGRKLVVRSRFLDESVPRADVAKELLALADTYDALKSDFTKFWLADCKDAGTYQAYLARYDQTIVPCRQKAEELSKP